MGKKVTIIGAGSVGSTIAYTMAVNGIATEIVMIDINEAKAMGEALDIRQGVPFCPHAVQDNNRKERTVHFYGKDTRIQEQ